MVGDRLGRVVLLRKPGTLEKATYAHFPHTININLFYNSKPQEIPTWLRTCADCECDRPCYGDYSQSCGGEGYVNLRLVEREGEGENVVYTTSISEFSHIPAIIFWGGLLLPHQARTEPRWWWTSLTSTRGGTTWYDVETPKKDSK